MPKRWTLYWVSSGTAEDCFVVARSNRSAERVEIEENGFSLGEVKAERVCSVPKEVENIYFSKSDKSIDWPGYVYGREFFEGVGAEFRTIDNKLQMLLAETVYEVDDFFPCEIRRIYNIGRRTIEDFENNKDLSSILSEYSEPDHFGSIAPFVYEMLGRCLARCQEIERNLANSFIFCAPQKNKPEDKTINDLVAEWRKMTFGQLVSMIKRYWDMGTGSRGCSRLVQKF